MERNKCIVLVRESTTAQDIASQQEETYNAAISAGYAPADIIVIGQAGSSAIKMNEQYVADMEKVLELMRTDNTIKEIFVWGIDRIGRKPKYLFEIRDAVYQYKIQLTILNPWLQLLTPTLEPSDMAKMAYALYATMAEQEMEHKLARFTRAKKHNAAIGKANGGAKNVPFGYSKDANGYFIINEEEAAIVRLMFELHNSGKYSLNKLALELNERGYEHRGKKFTKFFLRMFIKSTVVAGYSDVDKPKTGWSVRRIYPQIISQEEWEKAQVVMRGNLSSTYKGTKHYYLGAKLMKCEKCGSSYSTDGLQYRCKKAHHRIPLQQQGLPSCNNNTTVKTAVFDGMLWTLTKTKHLNFLLKEKDVTAERNKKQMEVNLQKIAAYKATLEGLDNERAKWLERLFNHQITDKEADAYFARFDKEKANIANSITNLENDNIALQRQLDSLSEISYKSILKLTADVMGDKDEKEMFELVHRYIKQVTFKRTTIDGKGCSIFTFYFYDGTSETLYYFSKNRKCAVYKRGKMDSRLKYAFTDSEGNSYIPFKVDRIERDKEGKIIQPEVSSVEITDETAKAIMMAETLKKREERNKG